jgi:NAD(P)-dependent dehydrogenase (short-subunit alcohol dehydrogenase family)
LSLLALITGASRGIGRAAAARFLAAGGTVWNLSRTPCDLTGVVNHPCDLSDLKRLEAVLAGLRLTGFSRITLLHNAALSRPDTCATLDGKNFLHVLTLNVIAPQLINKHVIPYMAAGSSIIFMGSTLSETGIAGRLSYVASKHALAGVMKATCLEVGGQSIHTCLVAPGFTDTQMLREAIGHAPEDLERARGATVLGRLATPEEIAELIFFCSQNPSINGAVLHANLGQK